MKKRFFLVCVMSILFFLTSCGANNNSTTVTSITLTNRFDVSSVELDSDVIFSPTIAGETLFGFSRKFGEINNTDKLFKVSADGTLSLYDIPELDGGYIINIAFADTGRYLALISYSKPKAFRLGLYDGVDSIGDVSLTQIDINDLNPDSSHNTSYMLYNDGVWYCAFGSTLYQFSYNGELKRHDALPGEPKDIFASTDGVHVYGSSFHIVATTSEVSDSDKWEHTVSSYTNDTYSKGIDCDYFRCCPSGAYYGNVSGTEELLIDWSNSNVIGNNTSRILMFSRDEGYLIAHEGSMLDNKIYTIKRLNDITLDSTQFIKVDYRHTSGGDNMQEAAAEFNRKHSDCRVILNDLYNTESYSDTVNQSIAAGTAGDIVMLSQLMTPENYTLKGFFADMYDLGPYSFTPDELVSCVRQVCETDGHLYWLPYDFSPNTLYAKKGEIDKNAWNIEEFISLYNKADSNGLNILPNSGRQDIIDLIGDIIWMKFLNLENNAADYDSPEFVQIIEWLKSLPNEHNVDIFTENRFISGEVMLEQVGIGNIYMYLRGFNLWGNDNGEIIGLPTKGTEPIAVYMTNRYGIRSDTKHPEYCMELLRAYLEKANEYSFSPLKSNLYAALEKSKGMTVVYDPVNMPAGLSLIYQEQDNDRGDRSLIYIDIDENIINEYIALLDRATAITATPKAVKNIIEDELSSYFISTRSAEDTADHIQSRVKIWLSERG